MKQIFTFITIIPLLKNNYSTLLRKKEPNIAL